MQFKLGETYICTESLLNWWTEGKEYHVYFDDHVSALVMKDNKRRIWYDHELSDARHHFKLKVAKTYY